VLSVRALGTGPRFDHQQWKKKERAGGMAQAVNKCEALSSNLIAAKTNKNTFKMNTIHNPI
jgi:hypothetical protein